MILIRDLNDEKIPTFESRYFSEYYLVLKVQMWIIIIFFFFDWNNLLSNCENGVHFQFGGY